MLILKFLITMFNQFGEKENNSLNPIKLNIKKVSNHSIINSFLKENFSSPTHWPDWNILIMKYFKTTFYYIGAYKKKELIGICPVHEVAHKKFLKQKLSGQIYMIPNGGWIFSTPTNINKNFFPTGWFKSFQTFSLPSLPEFNGHFNFNTEEKQTLIIDLAQNLDNIWETSINSKRRNMIRKAQKEGIKIESLSMKEGIEAFYPLYYESAIRYTKEPLKQSFFRELILGSPNISLDIWAAYQDNIQLANIGIISDKNYSIYWLGNNSHEVKNFGQGDLLQWHAIKEMQAKKCRYYDLCYIEPERLPRIYKFKKGFSHKVHQVKLYHKKPFTFKLANKIV